MNLKRLFFVATAAAVLVSTFFVAPASAAVNDFTITDFQADYYLARDSGNRSHLKTVERITAEFPEVDQNHGIERAIPTTYDGHPTHLEINSVTSGNGAPRNYTIYESNGNSVVRIGDADTYVHGLQTYLITYTQQDVTLRPSDKAINEFYWDINGTGWNVPFDHVSARVHMSQSLTAQLNGDATCYVGPQGSGEQCAINKTTDDEGATFTIPPTRELGVGENATLAIGFRDGTFAAYQPTLWERVTAIWSILSVALGVVAFVLTFGLFFWLNRVNGRDKELGTIVPEYLPPSDASVTVSALVAKTAQSVMTAQLLDLAVRHYVKLYEVKPKTLFSTAQYEIEIIRDIGDLRWEEQEILRDMFDSQVSVGSRLNPKALQRNIGFSMRTANNDTDLSKRMKGEYGLREPKSPVIKRFRRVALILAITGVVLLSIWLLAAAVFAFVLSFMVQPLTDKGLELKRYLEGLKLYIKVAEQERIKMLQSPEGAEKAASIAGGTDPAQLVKLYERVLPYAVMFGQEKQWSRQLGAYYENVGAQPDWYSGNNAVFNAAVFSSAMNSFSTSTTTYTSSSSSSSSGSGGGGSSGGGGGGGGGGGW